jgi:hypothetical protein
LRLLVGADLDPADELAQELLDHLRAPLSDRLAKLVGDCHQVIGTRQAGGGGLYLASQFLLTLDEFRALLGEFGDPGAANGSQPLAAACGDGGVRVWSLRGETWELQLNIGMARTWAVALAPTGSALAASTGDGRIRVWSPPSGEPLWEADARAGRVRSLAFDHSGQTLAGCGGDGSVLLWHGPTGELLDRFAHPTGWARTVAIVPPAPRRQEPGRGAAPHTMHGAGPAGLGGNPFDR